MEDTAVEISQITARYRSALQEIFRYTSVHVVPAASMSGLFLTLLAVLAGALGLWRLGVDPGWTSPFFVAGGLFSRYQLWFAIAIAAQTSAFILNRWVANQVIDVPVIAAV
ncbi:MAG TPA: hypothetical protein VGP62_12765 [Bryobacteraceae bacterium]|nr:hypothetical protein [Bryobacteraceae bacterium]